MASPISQEVAESTGMEHPATAPVCPSEEEVPQQHFRFLDLPSELRNRIYDYVCSEPLTEAVWLDGNKASFESWTYGNDFNTITLPGSALLRTCQQIHHEAQGYVSATLSSGYALELCCDEEVPIPLVHMSETRNCSRRHTYIRVDRKDGYEIEIPITTRSHWPRFLIAHGVTEVPLF